MQARSTLHRTRTTTAVLAVFCGLITLALNAAGQTAVAETPSTDAPTPAASAAEQVPVPPGAADAPSIGRLRAPRAGPAGEGGEPTPVRRKATPPPMPPPPTIPAPTTPLLAQAPDAPLAGVPRIRFDEVQHDFGEADSTEEIEHDFVFQNVGDTLLKVTSVRPHCGCTVVDWTREVAPGGQGVIKSKLRLQGFRGPVRKGIDVRSNDPATPLVALTLLGKVKVDIEIAPSSRVFFGRLETDAAAERVVTVTSTLPTPLHIEGVGFKSAVAGETAAPPFEVDQEVVEEGKQYRFTVRTVPPLEFGSVGTTLMLRTDSPKNREIAIPITAYVLPPVTASPTAITYSLAHPQYNRRPVYIRRADGNPIRILGVEPTPPENLEAAVTSMGDGKTQRVDVIMRRPPEAGTTFGSVTIRTDAKEMPEVVVKVRFVQ